MYKVYKHYGSETTNVYSNLNIEIILIKEFLKRVTGNVR